MIGPGTDWSVKSAMYDGDQGVRLDRTVGLRNGVARPGIMAPIRDMQVRTHG